MSQPKYYTPTVEDLVWGLEYEMLINGIFCQKSTISCKYTAIAFLLTVGDSPNTLRIKHLDEDDILELGWEKNAKGIYKIHNYKLSHHFNSSICIFNNLDSIYFGQCRNKAELKHLMNNLRINPTQTKITQP